jgi:hypothetical protein
MFLEDDDPNPDYTNDMNACMELAKEALLAYLVGTDGHTSCWPAKNGYIPIGAMFAETPQLAIIHAYLKSKGVELGEDND